MAYSPYCLEKLSKKSLSSVSSAEIAVISQRNEPSLLCFVGFDAFVLRLARLFRQFQKKNSAKFVVAICEPRHVAGPNISRMLSTMAVTPPNVATNRARKCSKALRLATLYCVENFSSAPLELFLLWLPSHTKTQNRGGKERGL